MKPPYSYLNSFPENSNGWIGDNNLINKLLALSNQFTIERIDHICTSIESRWRQKQSWPNAVDTEDLRGLDPNFPLISQLHTLCDEHGYGRVPQITSSLRDLIANPDKITEYQRIHEIRMDNMQKTQHLLDEGNL